MGINSERGSIAHNPFVQGNAYIMKEDHDDLKKKSTALMHRADSIAYFSLGLIVGLAVDTIFGSSLTLVLSCIGSLVSIFVRVRSAEIGKD